MRVRGGVFIFVDDLTVIVNARHPEEVKLYRSKRGVWQTSISKYILKTVIILYAFECVGLKALVNGFC